MMEEAAMGVRRKRGTRAAIAIVFALTLLGAAAGHAAIAVDGTSSASGKAVSTLTWSHTAGSTPNRILIVGVSNQNTSRPVSSVTYGGTPLTRIGFQNGGTSNRMELWSLTAPSAGTANVVVTFSGSVDVVGGAVSFSGVNQAAPLGAFASAQGSNVSPSVTVPSAAGQVVIDALATNGDGSSATVGAGQTQRWNLKTGNGGGNALGAGSTEPGASSVTMSWTLGHAHAWSIGAVPLKPGAACGDGTTDPGEDCDLGAANGTPGSCCT